MKKTLLILNVFSTGQTSVSGKIAHERDAKLKNVSKHGSPDQLKIDFFI